MKHATICELGWEQSLGNSNSILIMFGYKKRHIRYSILQILLED